MPNDTQEHKTFTLADGQLYEYREGDCWPIQVDDLLVLFDIISGKLDMLTAGSKR